MKKDEPYFFRGISTQIAYPIHPPLPKPEPSQEPPALLEIDKLIEESNDLYSLIWVAFKKNHPERFLIHEEPKEPIIEVTPKPKAA